MVRDLMIVRREIAFHICEFLIYFARMMMLTKALKLPGSSWFSEVFVSVCGLFQSGMQVFKGLRGKKHFHKLTFEDVKQKNQKMQEEQAQKAAAEVVQTILVPIEKNNLWSSRSRGYSARNPRCEMSFAD